MPKCQIDNATAKAIEEILAKGDRVEIIPVKDGVRVMRVRRDEVKCYGKDDHGKISG